MANIDKIKSWISTHKSFNVALRLPLNVIALDIDAYKGDLERLKKTEDELGKLPTTWNSDSRGGQGGKVLYRIPEALASKKWLSNINGITIIQHTHRYVMVLPSYNRESETRYMWYQGLGGQIIPGYYIPTVHDIAELPIEWAQALKRDDQMTFNSNSEVNNLGLEIFDEVPPCKYMTILIRMCKEKLYESYDFGLHDTGLSILALLLRAAADGHSGIFDAIEEMSQVYCSASRPRDLAIDWDNILSWQLAQVDARDISTVDSCELNIFLENQIEAEVRMLIATGMTEFRARRLLNGRRGRLM